MPLPDMDLGSSLCLLSKSRTEQISISVRRVTILDSEMVKLTAETALTAKMISRNQLRN